MFSEGNNSICISINEIFIVPFVHQRLLSSLAVTHKIASCPVAPFWNRSARAI